MSFPPRIAILGFTPLERVTLEALLRLSHRRGRPYEVEPDLVEADFVLVDGEQPTAFDQVAQAGWLSRCVMLGGAESGGAAMQLPRTINLGAVLGALDGLPRRRPDVPPSGEPASAVPAARAGTDELAVRADSGTIEWAGAPDPLPEVLDHILVVDDNHATLRFMALHLGRFGFQVHLARSGAGALARLARRRFEFVFVDAGIAAMGGFELCKAIRQVHASAHRLEPRVVLMTRPGQRADEGAAGLAGCDAVLARPLTEVDLLAMVGDREAQQHGFANTVNASLELY